jgi:hypothetical protein
LRQIGQSGYRAELEQQRVEHVLALGLAFSGKQVVVKSLADVSGDRQITP